MKRKLGHILAGSLTEGLSMQLESGCSLEDVKTGKFVCIKGEQYDFFSMITDMELQVTNPDILLFPPTDEETLLASTIKNANLE